MIKQILLTIVLLSLSQNVFARCVMQDPKAAEENYNNVAFWGIVQVANTFADENTGYVWRATLIPVLVYKAADDFDLKSSVLIARYMDARSTCDGYLPLSGLQEVALYKQDDGYRLGSKMEHYFGSIVLVNQRRSQVKYIPQN